MAMNCVGWPKCWHGSQQYSSMSRLWQPLFASINTLASHVKKFHLETRNKSNTVILCMSQSLTQMAVNPTGLHLSARPRSLKSTTDFFDAVIAAATESLKPVQYHKSQSTKDFDPYPLLLLQVYFQRLALFPLMKEDEEDMMRPNNMPKRKHTWVRDC